MDLVQGPGERFDVESCPEVESRDIGDSVE